MTTTLILLAVITPGQPPTLVMLIVGVVLAVCGFAIMRGSRSRD